MLKSLYIKNYALIETLDIQFEPGFSVITGETGAGKSIILGAIGLLLGQRADSKSIKDNAAKCTIEAQFDLSKYGIKNFFEDNDLEFDDGECIIRREIMSSGKSRAFINDTPVGVTLLKELGETLIDIHSQHQNLLLNKEDFQLNVIDTLAGNKDLLNQYQSLYADFKRKDKELVQAIEALESSKEEEDYLTFQLEQLDSAQLKEGEQEELEEEAEMLTHAEDIKQALYHAENIIDNEQGGALSAIREAQHLVSGISKVYADAEKLSERLESCHIELKDILDEISVRSERIEYNPSRLEYVNERLNTLYTLQQKHHIDTVKELIAIRDDLRQQMEHINNGEEHLQRLKAERDKAYELVLHKAATLSEERRKAARITEKELSEKLIPLGIPNVRFKVELTRMDMPDTKGQDEIKFLFSANKSGQLQPISQVASGGEIARVMLSLKAMISGAVKLPTIIFDEIDTGVSGSIAEKMALIMKDMGENNRQVISITHLPQIAALGAAHYKVYKEDTTSGTTSHIVRLNQDERVNEIANMLSGSVITEAAINNAKELLQSNRN